VRRHKLRDTYSSSDRSSPRLTWLHYPDRAVSFFQFAQPLCPIIAYASRNRTTCPRCWCIRFSALLHFAAVERGPKGIARVAAAALDRAQQLRRSDPARPTARREAAIVTTRRATTRYGQATCSRRWTERTREKERGRGTTRRC